MTASLTTVAGALAALIFAGRTLFSGTEILIAWTILALVLIVYFAFVFRRLLRVEFKKQDTSLNIDVGGPSEPPPG
jgi:hypothetical protein